MTFPAKPPVNRRAASRELRSFLARLDNEGFWGTVIVRYEGRPAGVELTYGLPPESLRASGLEPVRLSASDCNIQSRLNMLANARFTGTVTLHFKDGWVRKTNQESAH